MAVATADRAAGSPDRPSSAPRLVHQPALDGLRGAAVAAVLLYHAGVSWAQGGFLGVDAFFVLSGFLITSLLLAEWEQEGHIDLRAFWGRRFRRLQPALLLFLLGVALYAVVWARPGELDRIREDGLATLFYVANWHFITSGQSYFDQFVTPSPLRHAWSLAIEEQWYLVWPLAVLFLLKRGLRRVGGLLVCGGLALSSAGLMWVLFDPVSDPSRVYYGTDTRAQSLLVGALLAFVLQHRAPLAGFASRLLVAIATVVSALTLWLWSSVGDSTDWLYRGGFLLAATAVAIMITAAVQPPAASGATVNPVRVVFSWTPLRLLGLISYGVYLWHWPVYLVLNRSRTGLSGWPLIGVRLAATLALAVVSYRLIEQPIRHRRVASRPLLLAMPVAMAVVAGALLVSTMGSKGSEIDVAGLPSEFPDPLPPPVLPDRPASDGKPATKVLLVGDSVAWSMAVSFPEKTQDINDVAVWNRSEWFCELAKGPRIENGVLRDASPTCPDWQGAWTADVARFRPRISVLSVGPWEIFDRRVDGRWIEYGTPAFDEHFLGILEEARTALTGGGARLVLLTMPQLERSDGVSAQEWTQNETWRADHMNDLYRTFAARHPDDVSVIDLAGYVCPGNECPDTVDGVALRGDGVHYTKEGAAAVAGWLLPQLRSMDLADQGASGS